MASRSKKRKTSYSSGHRCFSAEQARKYSHTQSTIEQLASLSFVPLFVPVSPWIVTCTLSVYQETRVSPPLSLVPREGKFSFLPNSFSSSALSAPLLLLPLFRQRNSNSPGFTTGVLLLFFFSLTPEADFQKKEDF